MELKIDVMVATLYEANYCLKVEDSVLRMLPRALQCLIRIKNAPKTSGKLEYFALVPSVPVLMCPGASPKIYGWIQD